MESTLFNWLNLENYNFKFVTKHFGLVQQKNLLEVSEIGWRQKGCHISNTLRL